jgi:hypothetical protein
LIPCSLHLLNPAAVGFAERDEQRTMPGNPRHPPFQVDASDVNNLPKNPRCRNHLRQLFSRDFHARRVRKKQKLCSLHQADVGAGAT